jgi:hypothetical protein
MLEYSTISLNLINLTVKLRKIYVSRLLFVPREADEIEIFIPALMPSDKPRFFRFNAERRYFAGTRRDAGIPVCLPYSGLTYHRVPPACRR